MYKKCIPTALCLIIMAFFLALISCSESDTSEPIVESNIESIQFNIPESHLTGGFAVGTQAYTFNRYSVHEAIEMTAKAGGRVIELYRGQKLRPGEDDETRFGPDASDEIMDEVKRKLEEHDILVVNFGVIPLPNDEQEQRRVFDFAQKLGVKAVSSEPPAEAMDLIEQMVEEYDISVAIHNHPPRENNPEYRHWDPEYVLSLVDGRDPRIGVSADIGHYIRSNVDPVEALQLLKGRIISMHFTDVDQWGADGEDTVAGTGVADLPAVLEELKRQNFGGNISIEYETNWYENVTDVAQFVGFIRGWDETRNP